MPTILKEGGLDFRIRTNDHNPPHIHAFSQDGTTVKIALGNEDVKPRLLQVKGMRRKDATKALKIVGKHQQEFIQRWNEIHG